MAPGSIFSANEVVDWEWYTFKDNWRRQSGFIKFGLVIWASILFLPLLMILVFWYRIYTLPMKLLRKRSAMERGHYSAASQQRSSLESVVPSYQLNMTGSDVHSRPIIERRRASSVASSRRGTKTPSLQELMIKKDVDFVSPFATPTIAPSTPSGRIVSSLYPRGTPSAASSRESLLQKPRHEHAPSVKPAPPIAASLENAEIAEIVNGFGSSPTLRAQRTTPAPADPATVPHELAL